MDKYALIAVGGKQYKVTEGQTLEVQKLEVENGKNIVFDQVLLLVDGDKIEVGTPTVSGVSVYATYLEDKKGDKVQVFKYKSKSRYRKMQGARQSYSYLKIDSIGKKTKAAKPKATKAPAKKAK